MAFTPMIAVVPIIRIAASLHQVMIKLCRTPPLRVDREDEWQPGRVVCAGLLEHRLSVWCILCIDVGNHEILGDKTLQGGGLGAHICLLPLIERRGEFVLGRPTTGVGVGESGAMGCHRPSPRRSIARTAFA